jgi:hypothetical protein
MDECRSEEHLKTTVIIILGNSILAPAVQLGGIFFLYHCFPRIACRNRHRPTLTALNVLIIFLFAVPRAAALFDFCLLLLVQCI